MPPGLASAERSLWSRLLGWLRALLSAALRPLRRLPPARAARERRWGRSVASLPDDLRAEVAELRADSGAVREAVSGAVEDYAHLREVLLSPSAAGSPIDDAALLAEAELTLRSLVGRASAVSALVAIEATRRADRASREAVGDAMLHLRDQARALHDAASAAIRWTATGSRADADHLQSCAGRLQQATARAEGGDRSD